MKPWFILIATSFTLLMSACGTTSQKGDCKSYRPLPICSPGFEVKCHTTRDGCEQCGCVPIVDDSGRAPYEPR